MTQLDEKIVSIADAPSLYPGQERKTRKQRIADLIAWQDQYGEINDSYNLWGMDLKDVNCDDWLDRTLFRKQRHDVNACYKPNNSMFPYDYTLLMRDKRCFEMFASMTGFQNRFCISKAFFVGSTFWERTEANGVKSADFKEFVSRNNGNRLVIKESFGFGGDNIHVVDISDGRVAENGRIYSPDQFARMICHSRTVWLVQEFVKQHFAMNALNGTCTNTIRIITYNTGERIVHAGAVVRCGKKGSLVDNVSQGGWFTAVSDAGFTGPDLFNAEDKIRKPSPFADMEIPHYNQALSLVHEVHALIPELFTIGWDVIITEDGPMILEGNDGWDPRMSQTPPGYAQRKNWETFLLERQNNFHSET